LLRLDALNYREEQRGSKGGYWSASPTDFLKEDIDIRRDEFSLAWDYTLEHGSRLTLRARHARREQDTSDDYPGEQNPYMQVLETVQAFETRYQMPIAGGHALTFGAEMKRLEVRGETVKTSVVFPGGQELNDFVRRKGIFAEMDFSLPMHLALTAGLRYDDLDWTPGLPPLPEDLWPYAPGWEGTPERTRSRISPRARLAWKATPKLSLSLSAGAALMAPAPGFERVCCGAVALSNAFSAAETSTNYLLDADYVPWRWWKVRASLLRSDYSDYLQKMAVFTAPDYIPSFARVSYTDFALEGVELGTEMRFFDRLSYGFEWTHLRVKSRGPVRLKPLGPFDFAVTLPEEMIPFQPQDQGSAFVRWDDQARGFDASAQVQYTGPMFVQVLGQTGAVDQFGFDKTTALWIVNLRAQHRLHKGLSGYVGVDNVTNKVQTNLSDPRYEYNWGPLRGRYYYAGLSFEM
jgi:outer membrane receptor protein involved in Fe transport